MNKELLKSAQIRIPNTAVLINAVSKRVRQLNAGDRPYLKPFPKEEPEDLALREISEGKLTVEIDFTAASKASTIQEKLLPGDSGL